MSAIAFRLADGSGEEAIVSRIFQSFPTVDEGSSYWHPGTRDHRSRPGGDRLSNLFPPRTNGPIGDAPGLETAADAGREYTFKNC